MGDCGDTCETARWLGVAGFCNKTTLECICPEGYHGLDDWNTYNDCHVPIDLQHIAWIVQCCTHVLCLVIGLWGYVYLTMHWNFVGRPRPKSTQVLNVSPTLSRKSSLGTSTQPGGGLEEFQVTPRQSFFRKPRPRSHGLHSLNGSPEATQWKRQRDTLLALLLFIVYVGTGLTYVVPFLFGRYRFERNWYQDLGVAIAAPAVLIGLWTVGYIWYRTLPNLRLYGRLFNIDSVLIRYPSAVRKTTICTTLLVLVAGLVLLFFVPTFVEDESVRRLCDRLFLVIGMAFVIQFFFFFTTLLFFLRRIFKDLLELSEATNTLVDIPSINSSVTAVRLLLVASFLFGPLSAAFFAVMAFTELGNQNIWLFLNVLAVFGDFASLLCFYVVAGKLAGPKVGRSRSSSQSSLSSNTAPGSPTSFKM